MAIKKLSFATLFVTAIFLLFPSIDLTVSHFFYHPQNGWAGEASIFGYLLYESVRIYTILLCLFVLIALPCSFSSKLANYLPKRKTLLYIVLVCSLGAGVLVHNVIKELLPRERPRHVEQFGGDKPFTAVFHISAFGGKSFISGHSSMAFSVVALGLIATPRRRKIALPLAYAYGCTVAITRITQGGHFLSDVVYAALLTLWLAYGLRFLINRPTEARPERI